MTSTKDKDKAKQLQDKCQSVLNSLLRDEDNKYCVDCDSKGPRWASWNIGVFLCIRCAGIHRNLGVHISKVKSVNLDAWTPEQVVSLQQMGNSRARAVYEANLPDNFRRPQNDSGLESFVRAKYEHKKYIAREWVPPVLPKVNWEKEIDDDMEKQKRKKKTALSADKSGSSSSKNKLAAVSNNDVVPQLPKPKNPSPKPAHHSASCRAKNARKDDSSSNNKSSSSSDLLNDSATNKQKPSSDSDLLNLATTPQQNGAATTTTSEDGFSNFLSATPAQNSDSCQQSTDDTTATTAIQSEEESFFNQTIPAEKEKVKLTKDSILALYKNVAAPSAGGQFQTNFQQQISYAPLNGLTTNQSQQAPSFGSLQWTPSNSCQSFQQQQQQQSAMQFPVMHQLQQQQQMAAAQFPASTGNFAQFPPHQPSFQHGAVLTTNMAAALPGQPLNNQQLFYSQQQQQQAVIGGMIPNPFFATPTQQNASSFLLQQQLSNLNLNASAASSASQSKASTTANTNNVWH